MGETESFISGANEGVVPECPYQLALRGPRPSKGDSQALAAFSRTKPLAMWERGADTVRVALARNLKQYATQFENLIWKVEVEPTSSMPLAMTI